MGFLRSLRRHWKVSRRRVKPPQRFPDAGHFARARGFDGFDKNIGRDRVLAAVDGALARRGSDAALLEIGCGEGRALLELLCLRPRLRLAGLNKEPWPAMTGTESLRDTARRYGLFEAEELAGSPLPEIRFADARALPYEDASFDVVVSQVTLEHVRDKASALEEVWRVLRPGGEALLEMDQRLPKMPRDLRERTPRFVVMSEDGATEDLFDVVEALAADGFEVRLVERGKKVVRVSLLLRKDRDGPLALGLRYDPDRTERLALRRSPHENGRTPFWGVRSVFRRS